jgi:hypothetical protein
MIVTKVDTIPNKIQLEWYIVDSNETALEGKFLPERKSGKVV